MKSLADLHEFALVDKLCAGLARAPDQANARHEADAELIKLPGGDHLAVTIDGLQEEYSEGLLRDPEVLGWANVVHSLSDLAAVAAKPLGVLLSYTLPPEADEAWRARLTAGTNAALAAHGTFCLGGDTSFGETANFQSVGVGLVPGDTYLTRTGAQAGDALYLTGPAGLGNLVGLARTMDASLWSQVEQLYRPRAPLALTLAARPLLRAGIDTIDGLLAALDLLTRVNDLGFVFEHRAELYHPQLVALSEKLGTPLWVGGAFGMGDYELALVVAPESEAAFLAACVEHAVTPLKAGEFRSEPGVEITLGSRRVPLDTTRLMNLFAEASSPKEYVAALFAYDSELTA